jgi:hypothetical protein
MKIYTKKRKLIPVLLLVGLFFGSCFLIVFLYGEKYHMPEIKLLLLYTGLLFMTLVLFNRFIRLFDSRPAIEINHEGLRACYNISRDLIPWSAVYAIEIHQMKYTKTLAVFIVSEAISSLRINKR